MTSENCDSVDAEKGVQIQNRELGSRVSPSTEAREVRTAAMGEVQRQTNINKEKRKNRDCGNSKWKSENESEGFEWLSG